MTVIMDDKDKHLLTKHNWYLHGTGYLRVNKVINGKHVTLHLHHEVLPKKDGYDVDHINTNKLDNRSCNLRYATKRQNQCNRGPQVNNTTGYKGVTLAKRTGKFEASIRHQGKRYHLGTFDTASMAYEAYKSKASSFQGEFAYEI